jgi:hypothetical protein
MKRVHELFVFLTPVNVLRAATECLSIRWETQRRGKRCGRHPRGVARRYFHTQFYAKRGINNVAANSVINRMYRFTLGSSATFSAMLAFAYTGSIPGAPL